MADEPKWIRKKKISLDDIVDKVMSKKEESNNKWITLKKDKKPGVSSTTTSEKPKWITSKKDKKVLPKKKPIVSMTDDQSGVIYSVRGENVSKDAFMKYVERKEMLHILQ